VVSQDEARFPLVPTLHTTLGVKGHRPVVGTWDNKDLVYSFAALNVVTGQLTTRLVESPATAKRQTGLSKTARLQQAFAAHLHDLARAYPASLGKPRSSSRLITRLGIRRPASRRCSPPIGISSCIGCPVTVLSSISLSDSGGCCGGGPLTIGCSSRCGR
jgi:hypothetical protein